MIYNREIDEDTGKSRFLCPFLGLERVLLAGMFQHVK